MRFGPDVAGVWEKALEKEWLLTNGKGGYAGGIICGANTRRYHGLLISSPPAGGERRLFVSKLHEEITLDGRTYYLASAELGNGEYQTGHVHLVEFILEPLPKFIYRIEDVYLTKELFMIHGEETTVARYLLDSHRPCKLRIYPLINHRSHHALNNSMESECEKSVTGAQVDIHLPAGPTLYLASSTGIFNRINAWFYNMAYPQDRVRGQDWVEHHYLPGFWEMEPSSTGEFAISMSLQGPRVDNYRDLYQSETERQKKMAVPLKIVKPASAEMARAADAFIVEKGGMPAIIAGYPWFDEWGRDTMIALPGLLLVTGRWDEARRILEKFARYEKNGLLPNLIPEEGEPLYNTVDASLWYFQAVKKYLDYTGDILFVQETIYPVLKRIIQHYVNGTDFGIVMDEDGLITAGAPGLQLTWMDAKVGDWVVTPRHGKTVEVNALWYNALYLMTLLAGCCNDKASRGYYGELALRVQEKFSPTFWSVRHDYLSDLVSGGERDERLRPNQVLALSLPYRLLSEKQEKLVLDAIDRHLFTPYGLRTLAPYENDYKPRYEGDLLSRDAAYHQGTAWGWLMGPYITAYRRTHHYSRQSRRAAAGILAPLFHHLQNHGLASVAEIFDGDHPHTPRGCPFQAWSVAELLRACVEEVQDKRPESTNWVLC